MRESCFSWVIVKSLLSNPRSGASVWEVSRHLRAANCVFLMKAKSFSRFCKNSLSSMLTDGSILLSAETACCISADLFSGKLKKSWVVTFHEADAGVLYPDACGQGMLGLHLIVCQGLGLLTSMLLVWGFQASSLLTSRSHCMRGKGFWWKHAEFS